MDDGAHLVTEGMDWYEVGWNLLGLAAAFLLLVFLTVITIFLISDWRRARRQER